MCGVSQCQEHLFGLGIRLTIRGHMRSVSLIFITCVFVCACVNRVQAEEDVAESERHAAQHPRRHSVPRADPLRQRAAPRARFVSSFPSALIQTTTLPHFTFFAIDSLCLSPYVCVFCLLVRLLLPAMLFVRLALHFGLAWCHARAQAGRSPSSSDVTRSATRCASCLFR